MADFLSHHGTGLPEDHSYVARNFLLDEWVTLARYSNYSAMGGVAYHSTYLDWNGSHAAYLLEYVFRPNPGFSHSSTIDPSDPDICPETFSLIDPSSPFHRSDPRLHLLRVEHVDFIANVVGESPFHIKQLAEVVVNSNHKDIAASDTLNVILAQWASAIDYRPVFAGYWHEFSGLFGLTPADDQVDWADVLRDRMGLLHFDPTYRGNTDILLFRYRVADVPKIMGAPADSRPLVPPSVLDSRHSDAFCPSPKDTLAGHTINLEPMVSIQPCQEVLHPSVAFKAHHIWRTGTITKPVPSGVLEQAREWHLMCIRDFTGRSDYAMDTDA